MKEYLKKLKLIKVKNAERPPLHDNCTCTIVNGVWTLGDSVSGPCPICVEAAVKFNNKH